MKVFKSHSEYSDLTDALKPMGLVYGPVQSRRFGKSLGINLLGKDKKICSFNCPYCDLGNTEIRMNDVKHTLKFPLPEEIEEALREKLRALLKQNKSIDVICISGNGEPTLHPDFLDITTRLLQVRDELMSACPVVVLTNGTELDDKKVLQGLNKLDERILKMDAGSNAIFEKINNPLTRTSIEKVISGRKDLKDIVIQSMFVHGAIDNTQPSSIDDWIEVVSLLKPKSVQICTFDKVPATSGLLRVSEQDLYAISQKLKMATGIKSIVAA